MTIWKSDFMAVHKAYIPEEQVDDALQQFDGISLGEMDRVKLMDRFDTKFVFPAGLLPGILLSAALSYRVLEIGEKRQFAYNSTYYDTANLGMYHDHHNRKLNRYKVRKREYVSSGQLFFEIKYKSNKGKTRKKRIQTSNGNKAFNADEKEFLKRVTPFKPKRLSPLLNNSFSRITLVHKSKAERVTFDLNLTYSHVGKAAGFPQLTIAEIKQAGNTGLSDIENILKKKQILPMNFSKYCMGMVLIHSGIKYNRFKRKFLLLNKLSNTTGHA